MIEKRRIYYRDNCEGGLAVEITAPVNFQASSVKIISRADSKDCNLNQDRKGCPEAVIGFIKHVPVAFEHDCPVHSLNVHCTKGRQFKCKYFFEAEKGFGGEVQWEKFYRLELLVAGCWLLVASLRLKLRLVKLVAGCLLLVACCQPSLEATAGKTGCWLLVALTPAGCLLTLFFLYL